MSFERHVRAAVGYFELGMLDDAANELEEIEPSLKTRPEVLGVGLELFRRLERWGDMATLAKHLMEACLSG